ncbi:MAG: S49 family peptidase [Leptolyngbyaceae cyanobacterium HOT.MB2.61]|jgi:protease-4|nr:S49 family peptidase [Leptolyngbyaceae cyanobacterium HOT.MB2.61]
MRQAWKYALAGLVGLLIGLSFASCGQQKGESFEPEDPLNFKFVEGKRTSQNRLLELQINGVILNSPSGGISELTGGEVTYGYQIERLLERISEDKRVKGIFLRLSTPGGTVVGSDAIYNALVNYRKSTKQPVVGYVEGLSASGGVMSMVGADVIYAAPGSSIGSIGVIGAALTYYDEPVAVDGGLLGQGITTRKGIQRTVISAGRGKDLGNPFRKPTEEELRVLRQGVNNEYNNFVNRVARARNISEKQIRDQMGAMIFDNKTAQEFKLIDGTRSRDEAIADLAKRAKVGDDYQVVQVSRQRGLLAGLLGNQLTVTQKEQEQKTIARDLCTATTHAVLVYYGTVARLCPSELISQ